MANPAILAEQQQNRDIAQYKWPFIYPLNAAIPNNGTLPLTINIDQDSDFQCERLVGSAYGPTDQNGVRQNNIGTDFDLAGTASAIAASVPGYADRGLQVRIFEQGSGRVMTSGFVDFGILFTPGYGVAPKRQMPWKTTFRANTKIIFEFRNRDTTSGGYFHYVSIGLVGIKIANQIKD